VSRLAPTGGRVTPESAGWGFSGLEIITAIPDSPHYLQTGPDEVVVIPLAGSGSVSCAGGSAVLSGRLSPFAGPTDCVYLPVDTRYELKGSGRFALASARAAGSFPFRYIAASDVIVERRGAGPCARLVHNFGTPDVLDASRIIVCEVITPAGNWSSYPPHKHDTARPGLETQLEEIYYFEIAPGPSGQPGTGFMKAASLLAEVRSGDVALIPDGFHGPAMAVPGYDMYYLNVMAGPGEREWLICDDPAHAWIRETWTT